MTFSPGLPSTTLPPTIFNLMAKDAFEQAKALAQEKIRLGRFEFRGAAQDLGDCTEREVIISGPAGTGKSLRCLALLHERAIQYPGSRHLIARAARTSLTDTGLVTFEEQVLGLDHPMVLDGPTRKYRTHYNYPNGSQIVVGGMDRASKFLSSEFDTIFIQQVEECTLDDWETLITRLRHHKMPFQQIYGDANPDAPTHWIKQRCDDGMALLLESRHEDNPLLHSGSTWTDIGRDYLSKLDALTGVRRRRLRFGEWAAAENAIYAEYWDRAVHLIDPFAVPRHWQRFRSIDFGYTNPAVVQWWAVDDDGRMYMYREFYYTQKLVSEIAHDIIKAERWFKLHKSNAYGPSDVPNPEREVVNIAVCDHDAEDRATLEREGIGTVPADKRVKTGIEAVQKRLEIAGDGKPRLFIVRNVNTRPDQALIDAKLPYRTEHEFPEYVWDGTKEQPVKRNDHGLDCLRYAVMYLDGPGSLTFQAIGGSGKTKAQVAGSRSPRSWNTGVLTPKGNRWRT